MWKGSGEQMVNNMSALMSTDSEPFKETVRAAEVMDASASESLALVTSNCKLIQSQQASLCTD